MKIKWLAILLLPLLIVPLFALSTNEKSKITAEVRRQINVLNEGAQLSSIEAPVELNSQGKVRPDIAVFYDIAQKGDNNYSTCVSVFRDGGSGYRPLCSSIVGSASQRIDAKFAEIVDGELVVRSSRMDDLTNFIAHGQDKLFYRFKIGNNGQLSPVPPAWVRCGRGWIEADKVNPDPGRLFPDAGSDDEGKIVLARDLKLPVTGSRKVFTTLPAGTKLDHPATLAVRSDGKAYILLLWEGIRPKVPDDNGGFAEEVAMLAVFPEGAKDPTDAVEVKSDRFTGLGDTLSLGEEDAFIVTNGHANASQDYTSYSLFRLENERVQPIADLFTLGCVTAKASDSFAETVSWRTEPATDSPRLKIVMSAELVHAPKNFRYTENATAESRERFRNVYRWDGDVNCYVRESGDIDRLEKWNLDHV
ncbi:MAG TPA: hypothetical protein VMD02_06340 [Candidatus Omnitrophota bacterium]|nr:hypothetical protein [Candidatus Omnitrophota bacterium]